MLPRVDFYIVIAGNSFERTRYETIFTALIAFVLYSAIALPQEAQEGQLRYSYQVTGIVLHVQSQPMPRITVCFLPSERPISGRVPCVKTTDRGRFSVGARDVPDRYQVCASTTESPFLSKSQESSKERQRVKCTNAIVFGAQDESREVTIRFDPK